MRYEGENRMKIVAAFAAMKSGEDATLLGEYMSKEDADRHLELLERYKDENAELVIRQIVASENFSSLAEIHPAWILEFLKDESPRIAGIILRALPSKHVRYILKNMPPMFKAKLPSMVESFSVAGPVLDIILKRFEKHFLKMRLSRTIESFEFENLYYLKGEELKELIKELGIFELAMALSGFEGKTLHAILNRLDLKDARRLKVMMREIKDVSMELVRQARYTVLEAGEDHVGPEKFLLNIGLASLSRSMDPEHEKLVRLVILRVGPELGYALKRFFEEKKGRTNPKLSAERRDIVLSLVRNLTVAERIGPALSRAITPNETPLMLEANPA